MFKKCKQCKGRMAVPNRMNFQKSSKGVWVIFNPKIYLAYFGPLNRVFTEKIKTCFSDNEGGGSRGV